MDKIPSKVLDFGSHRAFSDRFEITHARLQVMQIRDVQSISYPTAGLVVRFDVTDRAARLLSTIQNGGAQC